MSLKTKPLGALIMNVNSLKHSIPEWERKGEHAKAERARVIFAASQAELERRMRARKEAV